MRIIILVRSLFLMDPTTW